jgi:hypothetical protein
MAEESAVSRDARPWGFFATFVLGAIALLAGQLAGMAALVGWYGFDLRNVPVLSQHGGALIVFIFVSLRSSRWRPATKAAWPIISVTSCPAAAKWCCVWQYWQR